MKKNSSGAIWGLILILLGISIASRSLGLFSFSIFFKGWWTLLIIIPNIIGLCNGNSRSKMSNIIGLCIGIFLLLAQWRLFPMRLFGPLMFAGIFVGIGIKLIYGGNAKKKKDFNNKSTKYYQGDVWVDYSEQDNTYTDGMYYKDSDTSQTADQVDNTNYDQKGNYQFHSNATEFNTTGNTDNNMNTEQEAHNYTDTQDYYDYRSKSTSSERIACTAIFNGKSLKYDYEAFGGGIFSVIFGGIDLDLRHAVIHNDVTIEATVIFGGMDIIFPDNVRVIVRSTDIIGGVDNTRKNPPITNEYIPTIQLNVTCIMGGVDIK